MCSSTEKLHTAVRDALLSRRTRRESSPSHWCGEQSWVTGSERADQLTAAHVSRGISKISLLQVPPPGKSKGAVCTALSKVNRSTLASLSYATDDAVYDTKCNSTGTGYGRLARTPDLLQLRCTPTLLGGGARLDTVGCTINKGKSVCFPVSSRSVAPRIAGCPIRNWSERRTVRVSPVICARNGRGPVRVFRSAIVAVTSDVTETVKAVQSRAR